jgi:hypothetical protein
MAGTLKVGKDGFSTGSFERYDLKLKFDIGVSF